MKDSKIKNAIITKTRLDQFGSNVIRITIRFDCGGDSMESTAQSVLNCEGYDAIELLAGITNAANADSWEDVLYKYVRIEMKDNIAYKIRHIIHGTEWVDMTKYIKS